MTDLTWRQYQFLTSALSEDRIQRVNGKSHLEAWDVRRNLIRVFGFGGFDVQRRALECIHDLRHPKPNKPEQTVFTVIYRAEVRLTIKNADGQSIAFYDDGAIGDAVNQPSLGDAHDLAMKSALSQALKRCAVNLGDQFGLSLYADKLKTVSWSFVAPEKPEEPAPDTEEVTTNADEHTAGPVSPAGPALP